MRTTSDLLVILGTSASLGSLWVAAMALWLGNPGLHPTDIVQGTVLGLVLLRVFAFAAVPAIRRMDPVYVTILFGCDILVLPYSAVAYYLVGWPGLASFAKEFLASWFSCALLVYPVVGAFFVVRSMSRGDRLAYVLPVAGGCFGVLGLDLNGVQSTSASGGMSRVLSLALGFLQQGASPWLGPSLYTAGGILFASLFAYSTLSLSRPSGQLVPKMVFGVAGVVALLVWTLLTASLGAPLALDVPVVVIAGVIWVASREA